jgi:hypothetical protein
MIGFFIFIENCDYISPIRYELLYYVHHVV